MKVIVLLLLLVPSFSFAAFEYDVIGNNDGGTAIQYGQHNIQTDTFTHEAQSGAGSLSASGFGFAVATDRITSDLGTVTFYYDVVADGSATCDVKDAFVANGKLIYSQVRSNSVTTGSYSSSRDYSAYNTGAHVGIGLMIAAEDNSYVCHLTPTSILDGAGLELLDEAQSTETFVYVPVEANLVSSSCVHSSTSSLCDFTHATTVASSTSSSSDGLVFASGLGLMLLSMITWSSLTRKIS